MRIRCSRAPGLVVLATLAFAGASCGATGGVSVPSERGVAELASRGATDQVDCEAFDLAACIRSDQALRHYPISLERMRATISSAGVACEAGDLRACTLLGSVSDLEGLGVAEHLERAAALLGAACVDGGDAGHCAAWFENPRAARPSPAEPTPVAEVLVRACRDRDAIHWWLVGWNAGLPGWHAVLTDMAQTLQSRCIAQDEPDSTCVAAYSVLLALETFDPDAANKAFGMSFIARRACEVGGAFACFGVFRVELPRYQPWATEQSAESCREGDLVGCSVATLLTLERKDVGIAERARARVAARAACEARGEASCRLAGRTHSYAKRLAVHFAEQCFGADDISACYELGHITREWGQEYSLPARIRACELGDGLYCFVAGMARHVDGHGAQFTTRTGESLLRRGCELGNGESCFMVGSIVLGTWEQGQGAAGYVLAEAVEFYSRACALGYADGCAMLERVRDRLQGGRR
jgi:TPR repeat protein